MPNEHVDLGVEVLLLVMYSDAMRCRCVHVVAASYRLLTFEYCGERIPERAIHGQILAVKALRTLLAEALLEQ